MFTLHNGDCLQYMKTMQPASVDCIVTDPPYGDINHIDRLHERAKYKGGAIRQLHKGSADTVNFDWDEMLSLLDMVSKQWVFVFAGDKTGYIRSYFNQVGCMTRLGVWIKTNPSPLHAQYIWLSCIEPFAIARKSNATFNGFYEKPVIENQVGSSTIHPTEKPVEVIKKLILASTNEGDTVFDPFMGSGTTGVACVETNRNFIGCELDPKYYSIAEKRIKSAVFQPSFFTPSNNRLHMDAGDSPRQPSQSTLEGFTPAEQDTTPAPRQ